MKESGIEWIGEIPEDWELKRLKYTSEIRSENVFFDPNNNSYIGLENIKSYSNKLIETTTEYTKSFQSRCFKNDVMFSKLRPYLAKVLISPIDGYCTGELLQFYNFKGSKKYLYYSLLNPEFIDVVKASTYGAKMPRANTDFIFNQYIPIPSLDAQKRIADFLDNKCAKIDSLINKIKKQIETLEQYKKSVITEAVTKGINPDVKMKDSGIEWIGKIPMHWEVANPKWHFTQRKDRAKRGLQQLTASQKYGVITQDEYMDITGAKVVTVAKDFDILKLVRPGDFVIHMRSFQGGLEYSEKEGSISSAYVMLIPQKTITDHRFYKWFFKSPIYIDALNSTSNLVRDGQAMRYANFIQIPIVIPSPKEQKEIADYLDSKCATIDEIIKKKQQQLETLEEYKKSLIFEYVTGKKEV